MGAQHRLALGGAAIGLAAGACTSAPAHTAPAAQSHVASWKDETVRTTPGPPQGWSYVVKGTAHFAKVAVSVNGVTQSATMQPLNTVCGGGMCWYFSPRQSTGALPIVVVARLDDPSPHASLFCSLRAGGELATNTAHGASPEVQCAIP